MENIDIQETLIKNAERYSNHRIVLGNIAEEKSLVIVDLLLEQIEFCKNQIALGKTTFYSKLKTLCKKLEKLDNECHTFCTYRKKLL